MKQIKLCVYTNKDIMNMSFKEQTKLIKKAMKKGKYFFELISPPEK